MQPTGISPRGQETCRQRPSLRAALSCALVLTGLTGASSAQTVEVAPFGGYRFGGDLYEEITAATLDIDGAPAVGVSVDVFIDQGLSVTVLYSHQDARVDVPRPGEASQRVRLSIDHWHVGGTQEAGGGRVRPFFQGTLGLTRFGGGGESEIRFSVGAGGGVKLRPARHLGIRLDGRAFAIFLDGEATSGICTPGVCVLGLDVSVAWQAEFTAGLVLSF